MNLCGVRVNRIQELWLTRQQLGDRRKASAVMDAGAEFIERCVVEGRAIALVAGKAVTRKFIMERHHDPVTRHFGDDRSGSDGKAAGVPGDNGLNPAGKFGRAVAVDQCVVWRFTMNFPATALPATRAMALRFITRRSMNLAPAFITAEALRRSPCCWRVNHNS